MFASVSEYCVGGVCYKKVVVRCSPQSPSTALEECYKKVVVRCSPQCPSTVLEECVIRRLLSGVRLSVRVLCWRSVL